MIICCNGCFNYFVLFNQIWHKIEEETVQTLINLPQPRLSAAPQAGVSESSDEDIQYHGHSDADKNDSSNASKDDDGMVYFGSRSQMKDKEPQQANAAPVKRAEPKVGRNDPCPCGSGKKFKHCHGRLA